MSDSAISRDNPDVAGEGEQSVLFAQLVLQQTNLAMMLLGKTSRPDGGEPVKDIEAARLFIDQLAMLEAKTKGNLTKQETDLLKQSLMSLRLAFVEAVDSGSGAPAKPSETRPPAGGEAPKSQNQPATSEEESRKKFSKKY